MTERKTRPYLFYGMDIAVCSTCLKRVEAKILIDDDRVLLRKWCPEHGFETVLLADDAAYWRRARERFLKPPEMPQRFQTPMRWGCPYDCGLCPDHQQHSCLTVVEITDHCNLRCPVCYAGSGPHRPGHHALDTVLKMLDAVVASEGAPDVVQLSGGEPTLHPDFLTIVQAARDRPIRHLMVNTNGIRIATDPAFADALVPFRKNFEIYLQFDSLRDSVHERIRGARLASIRQRALEALEERGISTTLVCTLQKGVNDDEIGDILAHALSFSCVRGVTFQPTQEAGRVEGYDPAVHRLTLTEVRRRIIEAEQSPFRAADIVPVPCHPEVLAMGYALKLDGVVQPLTGLIPEDMLIAGSGNTVRFEGNPRVRGELDALFSTGIGPEGQAGKLGDVLCCLPQVEVGDLSYANIFRVMIVQFLDRRDLTVTNAKKSCVHFARPDGTLVPFDTFNVFYRDGQREILEKLRG
ncbi:MAG: radical SAM protein [Alphaproteobacteria bacterium]|nr:radical SAM protein [Alphaproteobacteria bacterium]